MLHTNDKIHDYQLYMAINDIEHTRTKARYPQKNGICEPFYKSILQEFYQPAPRRKIYDSIEELQRDHDEWLDYLTIMSEPIRAKSAAAGRQWKLCAMANRSGRKSS